MVWGRWEEWELRRGREEEGDDGGLLSSTESEGLGGICGGCKGNDDNGIGWLVMGKCAKMQGVRGMEMSQGAEWKPASPSSTAS